MIFDKNKRLLQNCLERKGIANGAGTELSGIPGQLPGITIRELAERFHDLDGMERYVKIWRGLIDAEEKELAVRERRLKMAGIQAEPRRIADRPATPLSAP